MCPLSILYCDVFVFRHWYNMCFSCLCMMDQISREKSKIDQHHYSVYVWYDHALSGRLENIIYGAFWKLNLFSCLKLKIKNYKEKPCFFKLMAGHRYRCPSSRLRITVDCVAKYQIHEIVVVNAIFSRRLPSIWMR